MKTLILANVGTPQSASPQDVGVYLKEFLMDENIIQLPRPFRDLLVKGLIVPKRKHSSAEKYRKIWTEQGSPLLVESQSLQRQLQTEMGPDWQVLLAMQVGQPSIAEAVEVAKQSSSEIYFCPLYPQFATATTGGAVKALQKLVPKELSLKVFQSFYSEAWFIKAQAQIIQEKWQPGDYLLLSYHGLPVSQLKAHQPSCYGSDHCCVQETACLQNCYKAQCLKTSELLEIELNARGLHPQVSLGFQSRLGRARWIEPSTEDVVQDLLKSGVQNLKVACPSFVADCLETLEEIGMELKTQFLTGGGKSFELIPCVNSHPQFVSGLSSAIKKLE